MAIPDRKVRILFTIPNFDTAGSGKALLNIAIRLDKTQYEPHIMCMHDRGAFFQVVKESGIPVHILEYTTPMKPYWTALRQCWRISRSFKKIAADIIHSFHYSADYSEALAARMAGVRWVYTKKNMSWGGGSKNGWLLRSLLANKIIVQNTDMIKDFFPTSKKVTLIPRGVNVGEFTPGPVDHELRQRYGVEKDDRVIICVANLVPVKGIEVLIEAFKLIAGDFPHWKIWIVGDDQNDYGKKLLDTVKTHGLSQRIIFTGKQAQVKTFLDQADIFVLPTLHQGRMEGSPVSLLEAMANGKALVASNIPGIRDQLKLFPMHLFNPGDSADLVRVLLPIMESPQLEAIGKSFMEHAKNFTIEGEVERHERAYESILN